VGKKGLIIGILVAVALGLLAAQIIDKVFIASAFEKSSLKKETDLNSRFAKEKLSEENNLEERYQADLVSKKAMEKRIELQRKKIKELESQLHFK